MALGKTRWSTRHSRARPSFRIATIFVFLVPKSQSKQVFKAPQGAKTSFHKWQIAQDIPLEMVPNIPNCCAHLVRTIPDAIPQDQSECDLLNWLVSGGMLFAKQHLVLEFEDCKDGDDSYSSKIVIEINKKEHLELIKHAGDVADKSDAGEDVVFLCKVHAWDRAFLSQCIDNGGRASKIAADELVDNFKEVSMEQDHDVDEWARTFIRECWGTQSL